MINLAELLLAICAIGVIGIGCWWIHPPLALVTVGALVLGLTVISRLVNPK